MDWKEFVLIINVSVNINNVIINSDCQQIINNISPTTTDDGFAGICAEFKSLW